jgi:hypothetical protein
MLMSRERNNSLAIFVMALSSFISAAILATYTPTARKTGFFEGNPDIAKNSISSTFPTASITVVQISSAILIAVFQITVRKKLNHYQKANSWMIFIAFLGLAWTFTNLMKSAIAE